MTHEINTGNTPPCRTMPCRLCPAYREAVKEQVRKLLDGGIHYSPWSSPMVPVKKPDGSIRLCIDFEWCYGTRPPKVDDLLDQVGDCDYLSKLDLTKGFYQIPLRPEDKEKTAFCGKFRFTRMPFGLKNAPATFQRTMHRVLTGQEEHSASYVDDILIFSKNWKQHLLHIQAVLEALRLNGLTVKCQWGASKLEYLGHVVGEGQVSVPEARVEALRQFRKPVTKKDTRSFLGTTSYYRKFIPKYADHSWSLTKSTK